MNDYKSFLLSKSQIGPNDGFEPVWLPDWLFGFQRHLCEWAIRKGRAAIFADCGLGKTPMQLVCAENIARKTGGKVLIVCPLAVAAQTVREGQKFGIDVSLQRMGEAHRITITNYERLHYFNQEEFVCAIADESGAIKAFDGKRRRQVIRFFSKIPYRFLFTATPSPNDFIELGTQSECLGVMTQSDMLGFFFRQTKDMRHTVFREGDFWNVTEYTFKPHSEQPFWRWVASWARAVRTPSDIGFSDEGFILPPLEYKSHVLNIPFVPEGELFHRPAISLREQRDERKRTVNERCEKVAELLNHNEQGIAWCHYNEEGDTLERLMPWAIQVAGKDSDEHKVAAVEWFAGEKCLCTDPLFAHKLPAWRQLHNQNTSGHTTANIETRKSPSLMNGSATTANADANICGHGPNATETMSVSTDGEPQPSEKPEGARCTPAIQKSAGRKSRKSANIAPNILTSGRGGPCENTVARLKNTGDSEILAARYADASSPTASTAILTTATSPEDSEDCCAVSAISESGSSRMTIDLSSEQPCICGHKSGKRTLVSKPKILSWGVNWQCCSQMTFFPTFSFEQFYQGIRRCWRFGQEKPVTVHIVSAEGESRVMDGLELKQRQADRMFASLVKHMNDAMAMMGEDGHTKAAVYPAWLTTKEQELISCP